MYNAIISVDEVGRFLYVVFIADMVTTSAGAIYVRGVMLLNFINGNFVVNTSLLSNVYEKCSTFLKKKCCAIFKTILLIF